MTSVLLSPVVIMSPIRSSSSTKSTGTPSCNNLSTRMTSPAHAASWKQQMRSLSISMKETVKSKQFDVCQTLFHSVQSAALVQTLVQVKTKLFRVRIYLSVINNSHIFFEKQRYWYLTIKCRRGDGNSTVIIQQFNINNRTLTTKSDYLNMEK